MVLSVLLTLIAFGFALYGALKSKKPILVRSLIAFVVLCLVSTFAIYTYVKEQVAYMGSDEFQEETRKTAENMGKKLGNTISGVADGLESSLDEDAIERMAEKGARIMGKGIEASSKGFDETIGKTTVYLDESADKLGIKVGRAERLTDSIMPSFALYLEFTQDVNTTLKLTAFDSEGKKMDNTTLDINAAKGDEKIHVFSFEYLNPGLSGYCVLAEK